MSINYIKLFEDGSTEATLAKPSWGEISATGDYHIDGIWYEPLGYIADGSLNTSTTDAIPTMTSNTAPSGRVSASTTVAAGTEYRAADNIDTGNSWATNAVNTGWWQYQFNSAKIINKYLLLPSNNYPNRAPKDFTIQASNTGVFGGEEVILDTQTNQISWSTTTPREFSFVNNTAYLYYRIDITLNNGDTYCELVEVAFIEAEADTANIVPYTNQFTYLSKNGKLAGVEVADGVPVDIHYDELAPTLVEDCIVTTNTSGLNGNVKIVDFGTVYSGGYRYVADNPFGNENYKGCSVVCQIYVNGIWSGAGWVYSAGGYGTTGHCNLEGIVVQVGDSGISNGSYYIGSGHGTGGGLPIASAPCRVIVTYIGEAK